MKTWTRDGQGRTPRTTRRRTVVPNAVGAVQAHRRLTCDVVDLDLDHARPRLDHAMSRDHHHVPDQKMGKREIREGDTFRGVLAFRLIGHSTRTARRS